MKLPNVDVSIQGSQPLYDHWRGNRCLFKSEMNHVLKEALFATKKPWSDLDGGVYISDTVNEVR